MTKNTMPERVTVHRINNGETFPNNVSVTELKPGGFLSDNIDEYEYVRADIATGDPNEPLKDGQYRWVRHKSTPGWLDVARVSIDHDGVWMNETGGDAYKSDQYVYIGPVIRPPSD